MAVPESIPAPSAAPTPSPGEAHDARTAALPSGRSYAVVWSSAGVVASGRLELLADGLALRGRDGDLVVALADVGAAVIARGRDERVRGLPALALGLRGGPPLRIASLEGAGALHELASHLERAGLRVAL